MIISISRSGHVELQEADNFRAFKILDRSGKDRRELAAALDGVATLTPDGAAAWVDEWNASFDAMLAAARKFGWINEATGRVRAHRESGGWVNAPDESLRKDQASLPQANRQRPMLQDDYRALMRHLAGAVTSSEPLSNCCYISWRF